MKGQFAESKPVRTVTTTVAVELLDGAQDRDLRQTQINEIHKLLLRAAELRSAAARHEESYDLAV